MATLLPSAPHRETFSVAEKKLIDVIQTQLNDAWFVLYSLNWSKVRDQRLRHGECDFVVLHRQIGLIVVEAKPGDLAHGADGWNRGDLGPTKDPVAQAKRGLHAVQNFLCEQVPGWEAAQVPHTFAVYMSGSSGFRGRVPPGLDRSQLIFESDLSDFSETLLGIRQRTAPGDLNLPRHLLDKAVRALMPEFSLKPAICGDLQQDNIQIERFTQQQKLLMEFMQQQTRVLIRGCAGSGKTVLAIERARLMALAGRRVLLLCYNLKLCGILQQRVAELSVPGIDVFAFHSLSEHLARTIGRPIECPQDPREFSRYYDQTCPQSLDDAIRCGAGGCYDAIVVDEGQDFCEDWWVLIEELLQDPNNGSLYVFYDPHQNIFQRRMGFPIAGSEHLLTRNCRNTRLITQFVSDTVQREQQSLDGMPDGRPVSVAQVSAGEDTVRAVNRVVQGLVHDERLRPSRIVIVGRRRLVNSSFADVAHLAGIPLVDEQIHDGSEHAIQYTTVHRFKGLESDVVILTGFSLPLEPSDASLFYTAATRAKLRLFVFDERPCTSFQALRDSITPIAHPPLTNAPLGRF
jgi:hypothetical protein